MLRNATLLRGKARDAVDELVAPPIFAASAAPPSGTCARPLPGWSPVTCLRKRPPGAEREWISARATTLSSKTWLSTRGPPTTSSRSGLTSILRTAAPDVERAPRRPVHTRTRLEFNDRDRRAFNGGFLRNLARPAGSAVRVYRYLGEFEDALGNSSDETLERIRKLGPDFLG